jgi:hypothetical protein
LYVSEYKREKIMPPPIDYSGRLNELLKEPYANAAELREIYSKVAKGLGTSGNKFVDLTQRLGELIGLGSIKDMEGSIDRYKQSQSKDTGKLLGELLQSGSQLVPPGRFARAVSGAGLPYTRVIEGEGRAVEGYLSKESKEIALRDLLRDFPEIAKGESPIKLDFVRGLAEAALIRKAAVNRPTDSPFRVRDIPEPADRPLAQVIDFPGKKPGEPTRSDIVESKFHEIAARNARKELSKDELDKALDKLGKTLDPIRWTGPKGRIRSRDAAFESFRNPDTGEFDGGMWFQDKNYSLDPPGVTDEHLWVMHKDNPFGIGQPVGRITALDDRRFELHAVLSKGRKSGKLAELGSATGIFDAIRKMEERLGMMPKK